MANKYTSITITVRGLQIECFYDAYKGWPGSREEPPEYPYCEIWKYEIGGIEFGSEHLSDEFIEAIQIAVEEAVFNPEDEYDSSDDDERYEYWRLAV